ncbi:MAG: monoamine oxidase [Haliea sp.]|uniref:flavin monoamine oxidase family protein n=1 Tax=Haliea sp. TaxID=1932666 RepID=UPI000C51A9C2|nr:NAD(P)/FAD-dependent oxidoreductase [Haliea sp.]MBM68476.1 monoamine oxidase [Haliea sp.]|tara:strand:+ start:25168 stop:26619 length:1452 start_codon:yes stop_codon:yes gene_type:complete
MSEDKVTPEQGPGLNRRRFLGGATAITAGAAGLVSGPQQAVAVSGAEQACKTPGCDYDVVVIGGGNAGAAAARDSMKNGYRTLLLEARNRLGGRTFSADLDGDPVELGGFWIHHTQPFVWAEKERYGLAIKETPGAVPDSMVLTINGQRQELNEAQIMEAVMGWQAFTDAGRAILPRNWDLLHNAPAALEADAISVSDKLREADLSDFQKDFIRAVVATMAHNSPDAMSYLEMLRWHQCGGGYFPTFMDSVARFSLKDGTAALVEHMIADGSPEVRLSTPVKSVQDTGNLVRVQTTNGDVIKAGAVICCLPMNTIFNIDFTPPLPEGVVEAGKERHTGVGFKLYVKVKGDVGNVLSFAADGPLDYLMTYKQAPDYTLLVGFGQNPDALDVYDDEAVQAAVDALIPGAELLSSLSYDWNNDPYARGTYCSYRPGWVAKYYDVFQKDQGRVLFGSSDHGEGWRGFIDGAIGAGILAAERARVLLG